MANPLYGFETKLGIHTASPVTHQFDFMSCGVVLAESFPYFGGLRGTRERDVSRVVAGNRKVAGPISFPAPTAVEWSLLLPWILGAAASGTTYALADSLPVRYVVVGRDNGTDGKLFTYNGCRVNRARIHSTYSPEGGAVALDLDVVGVDETIGSAGAFPSLTIDATTAPFIHTDSSGAVSLASSAYPVASIDITIDNHLDDGRFFNSPTLNPNFNAMDRTISVTLTMPWAGAEALYGTGPAGAATTITWTSGLTATSLLLTMPALVFPRDSPPTQGRGEGMLTLRGNAYRSGATSSLVATLDSTP